MSTRDVRASSVERRLVEGVKRLGGRAWKWVSPGHSGVPDRIVVLPGGRVIFVELKTDTGKLSPLQRLTIDELLMRGCDVRVLYGSEQVEGFLEELKHVVCPATG